MLAHQYQIWPKSWGEDIDPEHQNEKRWIALTALAKRDRASPNEVFNELVSLRLGQLIGLPIPAGLTVAKDEQIYFVSCHLLSTGEQLPAANVKRFAKDRPFDACGVLVFDAWIGNPDRWKRNIWYDYYAKKFAIFDHGQALLGPFGQQCLRQSRNELTARNDEYGIAGYVESMSDFLTWHEKICEIPDQTIKNTCEEASAVGIDEQLSTSCANWLIERKEKLPGLFRKNQGMLASLKKTLFCPFGNRYDLSPEYHI